MKKLLLLIVLLPIMALGQNQEVCINIYDGGIDKKLPVKVKIYNGKIPIEIYISDGEFKSPSCSFIVSKSINDTSDYNKNNKFNFDGKNDMTIYLFDKIGKYVNYCYNDSTYIEYWQQSDYSEYQKIDKHGITTQLTVYIEPTFIKEYKHKEPTFIGFYEWLKTNNNK